MDQKQPELTFNESVKQIMQTLPPVVRAYIVQGKYTPVARNLMAKYSLRIDQAGVLEREIMLLLMGIDNPDEFVQALVEEAKLDQKTVSSIVQEVNAQIFIPLREQEKKASQQTTAVPAEVKPPQGAKESAPIPRLVVPTAPTPPRPEVQPSPRPSVAPSGVGLIIPKVEPPAAPEKFFHLQNKIPPTTPEATHASSETPQGTAKGAVLRPPAPSLREVLAAVTAEKHSQSPMPPISSSVSPAPPANLPGAMPPQPILEVRPSPVIPKVEPPKPATPPAPPAPAKPYSVDPYREPIE